MLYFERKLICDIMALLPFEISQNKMWQNDKFINLLYSRNRHYDFYNSFIDGASMFPAM